MSLSTVALVVVRLLEFLEAFEPARSKHLHNFPEVHGFPLIVIRNGVVVPYITIEIGQDISLFHDSLVCILLFLVGSDFLFLLLLRLFASL